MSEAKDDLIERLTGAAFDDDVYFASDRVQAVFLEAASTIASLTEQVERLTRERDDAMATISLLQSQYRKQQEHDTAVIEGLKRDVNRYASKMLALTELFKLSAMRDIRAALSNTSEGGERNGD